MTRVGIVEEFVLGRCVVMSDGEPDTLSLKLKGGREIEPLRAEFQRLMKLVGCDPSNSTVSNVTPTGALEVCLMELSGGSLPSERLKSKPNFTVKKRGCPCTK
jgi:hypothetical protein